MSNPVPPPAGHEPPAAQPGQPAPDQPVPSEPAAGQPAAGQPVPSEPAAGQPVPGQEALGQPAPAWPTPGQPQFAAQAAPGQPAPGQPFPGQPAAAQSFPGQAAPGQPFPGQPFPGQPYAGQPAPGQPGYPPPPGGQQFFELPPGVKKKSAKSRLVGILGSIVVVIIALGLRFGLSGIFDKDEAKEAKVGDCVAAQGDVPTDDGKETETGAEVVDCSSAKAKFTVVGRVEGETDTKSKSCDKYFTDENGDYYVYSRSDDVGTGYLLCLKAKA